MKAILVLPLLALSLSACVVAPPAPPMIARLPVQAMPASADGWRVVSVTPVAPGSRRDPNYTIESLPEAPAPTAAYVPQPVYVQQPLYLPPPVVVERPVYVDPWPVAIGVGLTLGWVSSRWCCGPRHHGHWRGRRH